MVESDPGDSDRFFLSWGGAFKTFTESVEGKEPGIYIRSLLAADLSGRSNDAALCRGRVGS